MSLWLLLLLLNVNTFEAEADEQQALLNGEGEAPLVSRVVVAHQAGGRRLGNGLPEPERGPDGDVETLEFFAKRIGEFSKTREDVKTWFDLLDLDDHVTFGGKP